VIWTWKVEGEWVDLVKDRAIIALISIVNLSGERCGYYIEVIRKHALAKIDLKSSYRRDDYFCRHVPVSVEVFWTAFAGELKLKVPQPPKDFEVKLWGKKFITVPLAVGFKYDEMTFGQLCDVICASNIASLIDSKRIKTKYEVYIAIMAITVEKMGVNVYCVRPEKIFTTDFGID
jgi:hypothetical protein